MTETRRQWSRRQVLGGIAAGLVPGGLARAASAGGRLPQESVSVRSLGALRRTVALRATLDHPQGLEVSADGSTWWVTSVLRDARVGLLAAFRASDGELVQKVEVQEGVCYHPGGLSRLGDALWVPVAEYRRDSTAVIQCRDAATLALRSRFGASDHIGALAATPSSVIGASWDARRFHEWSHDGRLLRTVEHDGAARYQDMKTAGDTLVAGGLLGDTGVIDVLAWPSLDLAQRTVVGRTDRDVVYTHEGLAVAGGDVLLMPEDDPARVFVFGSPFAQR